MLHLRKRGDVWHCRGSIKVGQETVEIPSFSTGCRSKADAEAVASAREANERKALIEGGLGRVRAATLTVADCFKAYLEGGTVKAWDRDRLGSMNAEFGARRLVEAPEAWRAWLAKHPAWKPSTAARWHASLVAGLNAGAEAYGLAPPSIPGPRGGDGEDRIAFLTEAEADTLLASYAEHVRPIILTLRYQGLRTSEALRLDWRNVDWRRRTLFITGTEAIGRARTKSRKARTVPMHRKVRISIYLLWRRRGRPASGTVYLNRFGRPYADCRGGPDGEGYGGNPLKKAHQTACKAVAIGGFRLHDWRHHWATKMLQAGCDVPALQRLGGWSSIRMLARYAASPDDHLARAMQLVA